MRDGYSILLLFVSLFSHDHMKLIISLDFFLSFINMGNLTNRKNKIHYKNLERREDRVEI